MKKFAVRSIECALVFLTLACCGAETKPPVISDALRAEFFKAQAEMLSAQAEFQRKAGALSDKVQELNNVCGDTYQLQMDAGNEPKCVGKIPVINKPPEPKK